MWRLGAIAITGSSYRLRNRAEPSVAAADDGQHLVATQPRADGSERRSADVGRRGGSRSDGHGIGGPVGLLRPAWERSVTAKGSLACAAPSRGARRGYSCPMALGSHI